MKKYIKILTMAALVAVLSFGFMACLGGHNDSNHSDSFIKETSHNDSHTTHNNTNCNNGHTFNGSTCTVCGYDCNDTTHSHTTHNNTNCNNGHTFNGSTCTVCGYDCSNDTSSNSHTQGQGNGHHGGGQKHCK